MLFVPGEYLDVVQSLFRRGDDGRLAFGPAQSVSAVSSFDALKNWLEFRDYIMEGHVRYGLRACPRPRGLLLEVRVRGSNRDKYVESFVARYVRWAGHTPLTPDADGPWI